jgi:hypothetical protein
MPAPLLHAYRPYRRPRARTLSLPQVLPPGAAQVQPLVECYFVLADVISTTRTPEETEREQERCGPSRGGTVPPARLWLGLENLFVRAGLRRSQDLAMLSGVAPSALPALQAVSRACVIDGCLANVVADGAGGVHAGARRADACAGHHGATARAPSVCRAAPAAGQCTRARQPGAAAGRARAAAQGAALAGLREQVRLRCRAASLRSGRHEQGGGIRFLAAMPAGSWHLLLSAS